MANNTKDVELRAIATKLLQAGAVYGRDRRYFAGKSDIDEAVIAFQQEANRKMAEMLDRLEAEIDDGKRSHSMAVISSAIEAERKQLEEKL